MDSVKLLFKEKISRFYAILLIFLIPILIILNSLWQIRIYQKNMNLEFSQKTELSSSLVSNALSPYINDTPSLQTKVDKIKKENPLIEEIVIIKPTETDFTVIASTNPDKININLKDSELTNVWTQNKLVIKSFRDQSTNSSGENWFAIKNISNELGIKSAILSFKINNSQIDLINKAAIDQTLILLVLLFFIFFLLLVNYFRFFEYFVKFRKIQEIDKMKDEFISIVSHEIKSPLSTVKGYLQMMLSGLTGKFDQNTKDHLSKISANIDRLDLLVSELLIVSKIEQNRMQFDMEPTNIIKEVEKTLVEIGDQAKIKGLEIENITQPQLPPVFVDPDRLHQVLKNIIENAIKYTNTGKITISYLLDRGQLKTTVKDTGIGMSNKDSKRLFERFYRIKNEKTINIGGTGLGLWISQAITNHMNGSITFRSQENVGSQFTLTLPFIKEKGKK